MAPTTKTAAKKADTKKLTITLRKSPIGFNRNQAAIVQSMGLRRINHSVQLLDTLRERLPLPEQFVRKARNAVHFHFREHRRQGSLDVPHQRRYLPGTSVLETSWHTPTGWLTVTDLLVVGPSDERQRPERSSPRDVGVPFLDRYGPPRLLTCRAQIINLIQELA